MVQRGSAQLLALTAPQETKLRTSLYPTDVYYLHSPRDKSLLLQTRGAHPDGKRPNGDPEGC